MHNVFSTDTVDHAVQVSPLLPTSFIQAEAGRGSKNSFQHASQIHML